MIEKKVSKCALKFKNVFNTNINDTVSVGFEFAGTEIQIANIDIDMFGKK